MCVIERLVAKDSVEGEGGSEERKGETHPSAFLLLKLPTHQKPTTFKSNDHIFFIIYKQAGTYKNKNINACIINTRLQ